MLGVLFQRYAKRVPQQGLFDDAGQDAEPSRPLVADDKVYEGAKIHLLHKQDRPYFYGIDPVCDAGSENAEQFLQLASRLVAQSETQLIRSKPPTLSASSQHSLLRNRAAEMIREWDFPHHQQVKKLADGIAAACVRKSLEGNASLGGGANAFGIPQEEFYEIPATSRSWRASCNSAWPIMPLSSFPTTAPRSVSGFSLSWAACFCFTTG